MKHLNCKIKKISRNKVYVLIKVSLSQFLFSRKPGREATFHLIKLTSRIKHWNVCVRLSTKLRQRNFRKLTCGVTLVPLSFGIPMKVRNKLNHDKQKLRSGSVASDHKIGKSLF